MVFQDYARFYDTYYRNKDYAAEVAFVLGLARRFGVEPARVLDMGCGTGRHSEEFWKQGMQADGFDLSAPMLEQARTRLAGRAADLRVGDLRTFRNGRTYDLAVAMFAVLGYLVSNADWQAGLATAAAHLRPGGILVFDGWFGPAVLAQRPETRRHAYTEDGLEVVREVTPELDPVAQTVTAHYRIRATRDGRPEREFTEDHRMRFLFVQELELLLREAGFERLHTCPFLEPEAPLSTGTWNLSVTARRL